MLNIVIIFFQFDSVLSFNKYTVLYYMFRNINMDRM